MNERKRYDVSLKTEEIQHNNTMKDFAVVFLRSDLRVRELF